MRQARFGFVSVSVSVFVWFRLFQCLVHDTGFYPDRLRTATWTRRKCWSALFETRLVLSCLVFSCLVLSCLATQGAGAVVGHLYCSIGVLVLLHLRSIRYGLKNLLLLFARQYFRNDCVRLFYRDRLGTNRRIRRKRKRRLAPQA